MPFSGTVFHFYKLKCKGKYRLWTGINWARQLKPKLIERLVTLLEPPDVIPESRQFAVSRIDIRKIRDCNNFKCARIFVSDRSVNHTSPAISLDNIK